MPGRLIPIALLTTFLLNSANAPRVHANERQVLSHQGVLRSSHVAPISSTLVSKIRTVVPEGTIVKQGDLLITLDDAEINKQLDKQQVAAKAAAESLAQAQREMESVVTEQFIEVQIAEQAIEVAQLTKQQFMGDGGQHQQAITKAEGQYQESLLVVQLATRRVARLDKESGEESDELIDARLAATQANTQLQVAKQRLSYLRGTESDHLTATLDLAILQSKVDRIKIIRQHITAKQQANKATVSRKRALESVTKRLEQYEEYLAQCQIFAPFDGVVQGLDVLPEARGGPVPIGPGSSVRPGRPILQLVKTDKLEVELEIDEQLLAKVGIDQSATLRFEAFPGVTFSGHVDRIYRRPNAAQIANDKAYIVRVSVDTPKPTLRVGMTAIVDIEIGE